MFTCSLVPWPRAPPEKLGKGPGSASMRFLTTITSQNFEEPIRLQNETMRNVIPSHANMCTRPKVPTMQYVYGKLVMCHLFPCVFTGDRWTSKSESAVYLYGLSRQTPQLSVGTGLGPDQLRRSVRICI